LAFQDVQTATTTGVYGISGFRVVFCVAVAVLAPDSLVAARAECPASVPGRRPVAGEQHATNVAALAGVVKRSVQLIDGMGSERVANFRAVERNPHRGDVVRTVVRDVGKVEAGHRRPEVSIEDLRNHVQNLVPLVRRVGVQRYSLECSEAIGQGRTRCWHSFRFSQRRENVPLRSGLQKGSGCSSDRKLR
jgi:hypothetical protein